MNTHRSGAYAATQTVTDSSPSIEEYIQLLRPIMRGICQTFGRNCEVVLHDFRDPEHSIVEIEGNVTNRKPSGSVTQIGLAVIAEGNAAQDRINYVTRTPTGRVLKSSTIVLRDSENRVFGALCINFDVTDFRFLGSMIDELVGATTVTEPQPVAFVDDVTKVIGAVIDEEEIALGQPIDRMKKEDRLAIVRALDRRGIFSLQRSVPCVAEYLQVSRATAYSYIEEVRANPSTSGPDGSTPD
jgi:predicted transcriptional regulator YheO